MHRARGSAQRARETRGLVLAPTCIVSTWQIVRDGECIELAGELRIADAAQIWQTLGAVAEPPGDHLDLDLHGVELVDGAIMSLLVDTRSALAARGTRPEIIGAPPRVAPLVHLYGGDQPPVTEEVIEARTSIIAQLGGAVEQIGRRLRELLVFAGQLTGSLFGDVRHVNWRAVPHLVERAGTDGIPIVIVLDFLVGFVMAYQSAVQLKLFGANIYVADLVGIAVTRELAPLMTAIIIAGRSGAAYAAELGTMRVSEEIDALRTMGFRPISYLVTPRTITLAIVAPVLTLLGAVAGVLGGMVVGAMSLGVTPHGYFAELQTILDLSDVWTGLVKSVGFGIAIAFIGCRQGLSARGAAQGVGRSTTSTVVACLFAIVVIDTLFTVVFRGFGV